MIKMYLNSVVSDFYFIGVISSSAGGRSSPNILEPSNLVLRQVVLSGLYLKVNRYSLDYTGIKLGPQYVLVMLYYWNYLSSFLYFGGGLPLGLQFNSRT